MVERMKEEGRILRLGELREMGISGVFNEKYPSPNPSYIHTTPTLCMYMWSMQIGYHRAYIGNLLTSLPPTSSKKKG
jgi:hypothetical protein